MLYHYLAADQNEHIVEGETDANRLEELLQFLSSQQLRPISVQPIDDTRGVRRLFRAEINITDKIFLTKYLSLMLRVGTDLLTAINILISDFEKPSVKSLLIEIRENLRKGRPFYEIFGKYPRSFSAVFVNLIKAAEASGTLQETFDKLNVSLVEESALKQKIRGAMIYPVILVTISFAILIFVSFFALPRIATTFSESGIHPPMFSRIVFAIGIFFRDHAAAILVPFFALLAGAVIFFAKTDPGRRMGDRILRRSPLVKNVYRDLAIQRFASTLSSLLRAGVPIVQALSVTADAVGSEEMKISLLRIANDGLAKGMTIGDAFRREIIFPRVVTNLVAISERAGHLEEVLDTLAEFYRSNIESSVKNLISFLEPVLLLFMGLMVALVALSIIVPIYQLASQF